MSKNRKHFSFNSLNSVFVVTFLISLMCVLFVGIEKQSLGLLVGSWVDSGIPMAVDQASNFLDFLFAAVALILQVILGIVEFINGFLSQTVG